MVRALTNFKFYVLHSHPIIYVPDSTIKSILTQQEMGCNPRGTWIAKFQEYDIERKHTKLVSGNGMCKAIAESQEVRIQEQVSRVLMVILQDPWFSNISYFLTYGECPNGLTYK